MCPLSRNPLCLCSKSNSIIFSLSLSLCLIPFLYHYQQLYTLTFLIRLLPCLRLLFTFSRHHSLSLCGTSHTALICTLPNWQPATSDIFVCYNSLALNAKITVAILFPILYVVKLDLTHKITIIILSLIRSIVKLALTPKSLLLGLF